MIARIRKIYSERKRQVLAAGVLLSGLGVVALFLLLLGGEDKGLLGEKKPRGSIKILRGVDLAREKWRIEGERRLGMIETEQREIKKTLEAVSAALGELEKEPGEPHPYPKRDSLPLPRCRARPRLCPGPRSRKYGFSPPSGAPRAMCLTRKPRCLTGFPREALSPGCC